MPNPSQEPPVFSNAENQDLKNMDVLCTFKMEIERQNLEYGWIKDKCPYPNQDQDTKPLPGTCSPNQRPVTLSKSNPSPEKPVFSQAPNQYKDSKPQSRTFRVLQSPPSGLQEHGCSLHFQNKDRVPKFKSRVYQPPVTISKSRSRCQTPVRNLQHPPKPQSRT